MRINSSLNAVVAFILAALVILGTLSACAAAAPSAGVSLDCGEKTVYVGESFTLTATVSGTADSTVWSSDDESVAEVKDGVVTALAVGDALIKVKYGTARATCLVTVIARPESISLDCEEKTLTVGEGFKLTATTASPGVAVVWASANPAVATVAGGTVKAVAAGSTVITASYGSVSASCSISVVKKPQPLPDPEVRLDINERSLLVGEGFTLTATANIAGVEITWSSSNSGVASVANGRVTAVAAGSADIRAAYGTAYAVCRVTVTEREVIGGDAYALSFGNKATTCASPGKWFYMCDGRDGETYSFAAPPVYDNGKITLSFNSVSADAGKHFQLRIQPDLKVGAEYTVKFKAVLSAAGRIAYGLSSSNTSVAFTAGESKRITGKSTVTAGEPFIIELLPSVRSEAIALEVSEVEFGEEAAPEPDTLKDKYASYFPIGAAVTPGALSNFSALMDNFNSVTPENDMKWKYLQPEEDRYSWDNADKIIEWAKRSNAGVRGHCLVWYKSLPSWLKPKIKDKDSALGYIDGHIEEVMKHFGTGAAKDVIYAWDVCNEALRNTVSASQLASGDIWRTGPSEVSGASDVDWYAICGTDYIKQAFKKADEMRKALGLDNVKLYYNDYNLNTPSKRAACVRLVQLLQKEGIAIDGVGMQAHYRMSGYEGREESFLAEFEKSVKAFTELGIDVQITELDIRLYSSDTEAEKEITAAMLAKQGEMYGKIFEICRKYYVPHTAGAGRVTGVTTWGVADTQNNPWNTAAHKEYPLIFDINKLPKRAFEEIMNF